MVLGITGGLASGKSTLAAMLMDKGQSFGAISVSADAIARELLEPGSGITEHVLLHFGPSIRLDGPDEAIDRSKLAARIFGNPDDRKWLENLLHPIIDGRIRAATIHFLGVPVASPDSPYYRLALAEIPLLYEVNAAGIADAVVVASCSEATQLRRLRERRPKLTKTEALQQIRTQLPISEKVELADYVIDTEVPIDQMRIQVAELFNHLVRGRV